MRKTAESRIIKLAKCFPYKTFKNNSHLFKKVDWLAKLPYLTDFFTIFKDLNISLRVRMASCFMAADKIDGQKRIA